MTAKTKIMSAQFGRFIAYLAQIKQVTTSKTMQDAYKILNTFLIIL